MYSFLLYILLFLFGGAIGSFIGVIIDRLGIKSFFTGRSRCDSCNRELNWYEIIPVFSFIFLKGRCKKCKVKIDNSKFLLELLGGVFSIVFYKLFILKYFLFPIIFTNLILGIGFSLLFIILFIIFLVIILYDLKHKLVPTSFSLLLLTIGLAFEIYRVFNYYVYYGGLTSLFWLDLFSGFLISLPFLLIYFLSKKKGVGFGDIIIYFGIGYLSGFIFGISIFFISIWLGALVSVLLMIFYPKKYNRKSSIPFAPFILIATIIVMLFKIDIIGLLQVFG